MKGKILVMDDQVGIRMLLKEALELDGHEVETVSSGYEFLEQLRYDNYDFLIMDLWVPDFEGYELVSEVKKHESTDKIMMISGNSCPETKKKVKQQGITKYLEKPFDLDSLKYQVEQNLEQITVDSTCCNL